MLPGVYSSAAAAAVMSDVSPASAWARSPQEVCHPRDRKQQDGGGVVTSETSTVSFQQANVFIYD